jgi:hypothetical protein
MIAGLIVLVLALLGGAITGIIFLFKWMAH